LKEYVVDASVLIAAVLGTSVYESLMKCKGRDYVASYMLSELIRRSEEIASRIARKMGD